MNLISVVIPTFNRALLLRQTLESVLQQTYRPIEIVVVDDGSTDETDDIVLRASPGIIYVQQVHRGHDGVARNVGINHSSGDYVAFVDSDDLWEPDKLAQQMALFDARAQVGMVYSDGWYFVSDSGRKLYTFNQARRLREGWIGPALLHGNFIPTSAVVIRRSVLEAVGPFSEDPALHLRSDWEMWLRIAARFEVGVVPERLLNYRVHARNATGGEDPYRFHRGCMQALQSALNNAPDLYGPLRREAVAAQFSHTGGACVALGRFREARSMYAQALRLNPRFYTAYPYFLATLPGPTIASWLSQAYLWWQRRGHLLEESMSQHKT